MTPDTIRKTTMIDENDTHTADLLNSPVGPVLPTVTVEGWGTGTVAELGTISTSSATSATRPAMP
jgi:hypothetical protein